MIAKVVGTSQATRQDQTIYDPTCGSGSLLLKAADEALRLDPEFAMAWNNKGIALGDLGKYADAIMAYDEAIGLDPDFAWPWNNKGTAFYNQGKYDEAIQAYDVCSNGHFICSSCVDSGFLVSKRRTCPLCNKPLK